MATEPLAAVMLSLSTSGVTVDASCAATASTVSCTLFTPDTWTVPQTVTVTGAAGRIDHRTASTDAGYDNRSVRVQVNGAGSRAVFLPLVVR